MFLLDNQHVELAIRLETKLPTSIPDRFLVPTLRQYVYLV